MGQHNNSAQFLPILIKRFTNIFTLQHREVRRFQGKKFVFTIEVDTNRYKVLQVIFSKSDIYASFPYFDCSEGILSLAKLSPFVTTSQVKLEELGKLTSHLVKFSYHPNGDTHFSQDGKILSTIRKESPPLANAEAHIFSFSGQGLSHFKPDLTTIDHLPALHETTLNFRFPNMHTGGFKIVANWHRSESIIERSYGKEMFVGPNARTQLPDGRITHSFLIGPPQDTPIENYVLVVRCEPIDLLDPDRESLQVFVGGFDQSSAMRTPSREAKFLCAMYPASNYDQLKERIGSVDFTS